MSRYYAIEKNSPIPPFRVRKYQFHAMKVGDSFSVPSSEDHRLRSAAYYWQKKHGGKYTVARMPDGKSRCWRLK